jgi:hypothetical protein
MKKCALFFTVFVILLLIASLTDKSNRIQNEVKMAGAVTNDYKPLASSAGNNAASPEE